MAEKIAESNFEAFLKIFLNIFNRAIQFYYIQFYNTFFLIA